MTKKERVIAALEHRQPDRLPKADSYWEDTLGLWQQQGMPLDKTPQDYFDLDIFPLSIDPSPGFLPELLDESNGFYTFRDRFGYVAKKERGKSRTLDFISYPAPDAESWQQVKAMFGRSPKSQALIDDIGYPFRLRPESTWETVRGKYEQLRQDNYYLLASAYGPHEATWRLHGFTDTLIDLVANPDLIRDIAGTYVQHLKNVISRCLEQGIVFDGFFMVDDVAGTRGMLFSPNTWRQIYKPLIADLGRFLKANNVHFWMHSCGNGEAIFEDLIECGVQAINPLEAKSGLDVVQLKKKYGGRLAFYGNIDVIEMAKSADALKQELEPKASAFPNGGFIYHSDHSIPPEVDLDRYRYLMQLLNNY